jgi:ABC-type lipoprotein release transport system permease subunit
MKEANKMKKQDKIATLFGIGLNVLVVAIIFIGATYYII